MGFANTASTSWTCSRASYPMLSFQTGFYPSYHSVTKLHGQSQAPGLRVKSQEAQVCPTRWEKPRRKREMAHLPHDGLARMGNPCAGSIHTVQAQHPLFPCMAACTPGTKSRLHESDHGKVGGPAYRAGARSGFGAVVKSADLETSTQPPPGALRGRCQSAESRDTWCPGLQE